jgi:hypothetical protein
MSLLERLGRLDLAVVLQNRPELSLYLAFSPNEYEP